MTAKLTVRFFDYECYGIKKSRDRTTSGSSTPHTHMRGSEIVQQAGRIIIVDWSYSDVDDTASLVEGCERERERDSRGVSGLVCE